MSRTTPRITFHGNKQRKVWKTKERSGLSWHDHILYLTELSEIENEKK